MRKGKKLLAEKHPIRRTKRLIDLVLHEFHVAAVDLHLLHLLLPLLTAQKSIGFHHQQLLFHVSQSSLHRIDFCILGVCEEGLTCIEKYVR